MLCLCRPVKRFICNWQLQCLALPTDLRQAVDSLRKSTGSTASQIRICGISRLGLLVSQTCVLGQNCQRRLANHILANMIKSVNIKVPTDHAIRTKWAVAGPFYREFAEKMHAQGIQSLTTGGNACIVYALAQATKDCDIIVPLDKSDEVLKILADTTFLGAKPYYYLKYGAPFTQRWLEGGWSSHTYFGPESDPSARLDLFVKPPRVDHPGYDTDPLYLSRDGVARMKKTRRLRDWAYADLLGMQMLREKKDVHGLLHVTSIRELVEYATNVEIPSELIQERPLLRLARENNPELERYVKAEMEFWQKLDDLRLNVYLDAWKPYGQMVQKDKRLSGMHILEQHERLVEIAAEFLEPDPIAEIGENHLIQTAKTKTEGVFGKLNRDLLPNPTIFARS